MKYEASSCSASHSALEFYQTKFKEHSQRKSRTHEKQDLVGSGEEYKLLQSLKGSKNLHCVLLEGWFCSKYRKKGSKQ